METVQKSFIGMLFLVLLCVMLTGILSLQIRIGNAHRCHADAVAQIEESNFNASVMEACITDATQRGYERCITLYHSEKGTTKVTSRELVGDTDDVYLAEVELRYPCQFRLIGMNEMQTIRGVARG